MARDPRPIAGTSPTEQAQRDAAQQLHIWMLGLVNAYRLDQEQGTTEAFKHVYRAWELDAYQWDENAGDTPPALTHLDPKFPIGISDMVPYVLYKTPCGLATLTSQDLDLPRNVWRPAQHVIEKAHEYYSHQGI